MRLGSWQCERTLQRAALACFAIITACDNSPPPDVASKDLSISEEVFRMFCMRTVRDAYPEDPNGMRFSPSCEGAEVPDDIRNDDRATKLVALLDRRPTAIAALDQILGKLEVAKSQTFAHDELKEFTWKLLPFYSDDADDATMSKLLPRSTEALGKVMQRLSDKDDPDAADVRKTIARLSEHLGYRTPDRVLAVVRPALSYDRLDELSAALLGLVAAGGDGHDTFMEVLQGLTLELAEPAEAKNGRTTLDLALDLFLTPSDLYAQAETRTLDPLPVLKRDDDGNAMGTGDVSPFPVAGRVDNADRASGTELALSSSEPAYETFDANQTALASLLRDSIPLIRRGDKDRSTVENILRASRPLLGKDGSRTETFGGKTLSYTGPEIEKGPMGNFLWSITSLLKLPQTRPLLQVIDQLLATDEASATALIGAARAIWEKSNDPAFAGKLNGPHEFWDDLIEMGQRIVARDGLMRDILSATLTAETVGTGKVLGHQMMFKDLPKLATETDVNSEVVTGCKSPDGGGPAPAFCVPVDRSMSGGDVGMNRSLFQRTLSLVHATYKSPNCNKEGATLTVQQPVPTTFPNPPLGPLAPIIGALGGGAGDCPTSTVAPPPATSYKACSLIEEKSGAVTLMLAMLGKSKIVIKDDEVTKCANAVGEKVPAAQERESGIKGFTLSPGPKALARFIYAPRNKFLTDMFDPYPTIEKVPVVDFEPNGMYSLEVVDPDAIGSDGKPLSFITAAAPLMTAFDKYDTIDANGDAPNGYLFAELLDMIHMHYDSPHTDLCPAAVVKGTGEGCSQSADPTKGYYAYGTNAVSYEPLLSWALLDQDLLGVLNRSTKAIDAITVTVDGQEKKGLDVLSDFLVALLKSSDLKYKDGRSYAKTNLCASQDPSDPTKCACPAGFDPTDDGLWCKMGDSTYRRRGRIIPGGVPPLYLMLDALNDIDSMWAAEADKHKIYLDVRSTLVDLFLNVDKDADGKTKLHNRRAYALTRNALPWLLARMDEHKDDLATWADGLVDRLAGVLAHPIAARGMDLFDKFWDDKAAGDEVAALTDYLLDEDANPEQFADLIVAAADTLTFLNKDPDLTPAIRFAAIALAEDALDVVNSGGQDPNVDEGTAYRFLEVTRAITQVDDGPELSTLAKLLRNAVLPMDGDLSGKSPLEVLIDLIADVNRLDPTKDTSVTLSAEDNQNVFVELLAFLSDPDVGLERLYQVIENRELPQ
jgi:hypothetical protein